jgi:hypothetical protein
MYDDRAVKKVFMGKPDERRKAGRPKRRWLECIENDLKYMGVQDGERKQKTDPCGLKEALVKL